TRPAPAREPRRAFGAEPEAEGLLVADYAQIEFRVLAHLAGDEALVGAFLGGEDVHATVAGGGGGGGAVVGVRGRGGGARHGGRDGLGAASRPGRPLAAGPGQDGDLRPG